MRARSLLVLFIMLSIIIPFSSVSMVTASTGAPKLGGIDESGNLLLANNSVTLVAGEQIILKIDDFSVYGYSLAILFSYGDETLVTFAGAGFDLYMSKDYYSYISPDDILYASGFSVNDLSNAYPINRNIANPVLKNGSAPFQLGTANLYDSSLGSNVSCKVLVGPIPAKISADYQYVKIFDGSSEQVGVSQIVKILPSLTLDPTSGSAGTSVTISGIGLPSNKTLNLYYSSPINSLITQVMTDPNGLLNYSWKMFDLANDYSTTPSQSIVISVHDADTNASVGNLTFTENSRVFTLINGESNSTNAGNDTALVDVKTLGKLQVVGNNFYPGSAAFSIDGNTLGTAPVNADSTFNTTFTVPQLTNGIHTVTVVNNGIAYAFKVRALPTLIGTPDSGPPGTLLQLEAYAFEPNTSYYVYWYGLTFGDYTWYNLINCTTNSEGRFSANLTIPSSYGGSHAIAATSAFYGQNSSSISIYAFASFTMKPTSTVYISFQQSGIDSDATGTVLVVDGTSFSSSQLPIVFSWLSGTAHAFSWASPVSSSMGKRYAWSSTSGLSGDQSGVITTTFSNGSVTASYQVQYLLTTTVSPLSGGTVNPSGINWHDAGVTVQVSAIAASGYIFGNWSGDLNGSLNPSPVLMNEAKNVTANFVQKQNTTITIAASPSSINLGSSITISGAIGAVTPANIVLYQSVNGSSFTIATVMQAVNGSYQYTLTPLSSGAYQFKTFWAGNDQYYSVESAIASVTVAPLPAPVDYTIYVILIIIVAIVVVAIIAYTRRK